MSMLSHKPRECGARHLARVWRVAARRRKRRRCMVSPMDEPLHQSFSATLSARERRLASRIEGFGDIVFCFAVSQCALQLPTDRGRVDLSHPLSLLIYFLTFAFIASLWITFHRMMSSTFRPAGVDLSAAFGYLASISLIPYAMYATHIAATIDAARWALLDYMTVYAAASAVAAFITWRNLRRGWPFTDDVERDTVWLSLLRRCVVGSLMVVGIAIDAVFGPVPGAASFESASTLCRTSFDRPVANNFGSEK